MPERQMTFAGARGFALGRAAETMLRALGGCEVALRFPVVLADGGNVRLGTAPVASEDVPVSPVVVRRANKPATEPSAQLEFVFPATAVELLLEQRGPDAESMFRSISGIVYQSKSFRVTDVQTDFYAGAAWLYRVSASE